MNAVPSAPHRVLVVEDEPDLLFLAELALSREGFEVTGVGSAEEAVEHLSSHDLLLLDIRLPGISGLDLLRQHVADGGSAPAIVMSAHAGVDIQREALLIGAAMMLVKPFNASELVQAIRSQLAA